VQPNLQSLLGLRIHNQDCTTRVTDSRTISSRLMHTRLQATHCSRQPRVPSLSTAAIRSVRCRSLVCRLLTYSKQTSTTAKQRAQHGTTKNHT